MHVSRVPLLNANEDALHVNGVSVSEGDRVAAGQLLFSLESTKTSTDVEAPAAGWIRRVAVAEGDRVAVGALLCVLTEGEDEAIEELPEDAVQAASSVKATRRARELAEAEGIDIEAVDARGIVKERDVRRYLEEQGKAVASVEAVQRPAIVVLGAGGHARVMVDLIRQARSDLEIVGALDDAEAAPDTVLGVPVLGGSDRLAELRDRGVRYGAVGVGAVTHNATRVSVYQKLRDAGLRVPALIHPRAVVEPSARLAEGTQIFGGAIVGSNAEIGENAIVNSGTIVSHDCRIGAHAHLTPGAILAGGVVVGSGTVVGMGASIYIGVRIGREVVISNGVDVLVDVPDGSVVRLITGDSGNG